MASRAVLISLVVVLIGIVVWQRSARPPDRPAVHASHPPASHKKGVKVLPSMRLQHPLDLSLAGIQELPPPHKATPKVPASRAIATARARHTPGATSVRPVLVLVTDPTARLSKTLAWDVRETGCFGTRGAAKVKTPPVACDGHRLVIVDAGSGALVETVTF